LQQRAERQRLDMFVIERLADCFRQLFALQALVVRLMLRQLLPGGGHELLLLKANHLRSETGGNPVPGIQIKFTEPVRSIRAVGNSRLLRVPLPVERRADEGYLTIGRRMFSRRIEDLAQRRLKRRAWAIGPGCRLSVRCAQGAFESQRTALGVWREIWH